MSAESVRQRRQRLEKAYKELCDAEKAWKKNPKRTVSNFDLGKIRENAALLLAELKKFHKDDGELLSVDLNKVNADTARSILNWSYQFLSMYSVHTK